MKEETFERQIEATSQPDEAVYKTIISTAMDGFCLVDSQGNFLDMNDAYCRMMGYGREELLAMKISDIEAKESLQETIQHMERVKEVGWDRFETRNRRKDGRIIPVEVSVNYMIAAGGRFFVFLRDITDRLRTQEELWAQQNLLRQIAANYPHSYVSIINKDLTVGFTSGQEFAKQHLNPDDFVGLTLAQVFREHTSFVREHYLRTFQGSETTFELFFNDQHQLYRTVPLYSQRGQIDRILAVVENINERKQAEEALRRAHDELEKRVEERTVELLGANWQLHQEIQERKHKEEELRESESRLHLLSSKILTAQETERKRISRELHDELGQSLTVMKLRVSFIEKELRKNQVKLREECEWTLQYLNQVMENVRRLSRELSPSILEDLGLMAALRWLINNFIKNNEMQITFNMTEIDHLFPRDAQMGIYRILQEALTNISKHAQAKNIIVVIEKNEDGILMRVEDDGKGFDPTKALLKEAAERGWGLATMKERARILGGSLDLWSQEGEGTQISLRIPRVKGRNLL
jgi:PAS domain S-box-containing protein